MRQIILLVAVVALVGCGKKAPPAHPETKPKPKAVVKKPIPAKPTPAEPTPAEKAAAIKKASNEAQAKAFVNTLGMKFVPVPGTAVAFCIWETRVKDYAVYAAANAGVDDEWNSPILRLMQMETHPVRNVSWEDAQAFCAWLTKKELTEGKIKADQKYRLPTDAEWSVAVGVGVEEGSTPEEKSGGVKDVYPWGKEWPPPKGVGNYSYRLQVDEYENTWPVGNIAANGFGLHDMGGSVWEWCEDKYRPTVKFRVMRGASYLNYRSDVLLSSHRIGLAPREPNHEHGFRCVLTNE